MMDYMMEQQTIDAFLRKARESLESAESEFANRRYNSCANRCYYACFQAAVAALLAEGIEPRDPRGQWGHDYVQAAFSGHLINRRKLYPGSLGEVLPQLYQLRQQADYSSSSVTQKRADRALRRSQQFFQVIRRQGDSR